MAVAAETTTLISMIVAWYASSAVCGWSSKLILGRFEEISGVRDSILLSLLQFVGTAMLANLHARSRGKDAYQHALTMLEDGVINQKLWRVAMAFCFGFAFVNATFAETSVPMAETLRALEPVSTVVLTLSVLREQVGGTRLLTLIPIVGGAALASAQSIDFTAKALALATMSNLMFSFRSIFVKDLKRVTAGAPIDSANTFFHLVVRGLPVQFLIVAVFDGSTALQILKSPMLYDSRTLLLLAVNSVCFFLYNCLSFLVLARVNVVSHAVANGFRRAATIAFSLVAFAMVPAFLNVIGISTATLGVVAYAVANARENAAKAKGASSPSQEMEALVNTEPVSKVQGEDAKTVPTSYRGTGSMLRQRGACQMN